MMEMSAGPDSSNVQASGRKVIEVSVCVCVFVFINVTSTQAHGPEGCQTGFMQSLN